MKYLLIAFAIFLTAFAPTSSVTFGDLRGSADPNSESITLQWTTSNEDGVKDFAVQKASQVGGYFVTIGRVAARGTGTAYQYVDGGIYKVSSSAIFTYQIVAEDINGNAIAASSPIAVSYTFSSSLSGVAKRTWGSIKAMFR